MAAVITVQSTVTAPDSSEINDALFIFCIP
ncbi:MAG: hypothetical protein ACI9VX_001063 [Dinoroseobacter sp.]|jgi:hypothetical protein